jgi:eukaryotic-like serine/threonine-protein kinase
MASQRELLKKLFETALDLKPEQRAAFLDQACNGDLELKEGLEALLAAHADADSFLEHPIPQGLTIDSVDSPKAVIGAYHLLELIGTGGMGEVWLAEQKQPVRRRVAIKLIKAGMDTREVVARFESERQALALMDHPAIAKVFEAGSTPEGRPYFVMEYVAGMPITAYCDKHKLIVRQRLELFILVCEGVQHAHQKAIIHRDLKPSNILVTEVDGKPMPRIIDFGVAKATSQKLTAGTMYTRVGTFIGTVGYMSPEQADPIGEDIDTRTDVYSLGAVLYELLTSALPVNLEKLPYDEVLRRLRDQDAPRPSTKIPTLGEKSTVAAKNRGADPPALIRELRGDPDSIALKALEKDRARRYATPSELAADIGRYLRNEPVIAHPPSTAYRARKYIRRHRLGVAVAGVGVLLLVGFAIVQGVQLRNIRRERDRADRITQFMAGMFKVSNPSEARGNTVSAREILDKASKEIDTGLSNDPELQAKMMYTMADTYHGLGLYTQAQPLLERAVEIQRRVLGLRNPDTLRSMHLLATVIADQGHYAEAEKLYRETLDIQRRALGPEHPDTLISMRRLAITLCVEGRCDEAEKLQRETLDTQRRVLGPEHPATLDSMWDLTNTLKAEHRYAEAEKLDRATLDIRRRVLGPEHPDTLRAMEGLAYTMLFEVRFAEAEKLFRETLDIQRRILGPEHPDTLDSAEGLAYALQLEGRYADGEKLLRETLDIQRRVLGPEHPDTLMSQGGLAMMLKDEGRYAEAEKLQRETLEAARRVFGPEHPNTLGSLENVAIDLSYEGRYGDAEKLFHEAILTAGKANQPSELAEAWYDFACGAAVAGRHDDAFDYLGRAVDLRYARPEWMAGDPDLKSLHGDPRFEALVAKARQNATVKPQ